MDHVSWSLGLLSKTTSWLLTLTQNWETMAPQTLPTVDLFYFNMHEAMSGGNLHLV
jgi:hypothetical protein